MEVVICNSLNEIETTINKLKHASFELVYRGLPNHNYALQTRIEDKFRDKIKANKCVQRMITQFKMIIAQEDFHNKIYWDDFKYNTPNFKNDWLLACQAQHLGIPTMLMDWTIDWKKALFFSAFDLRNEEKSGSLWAFDVNGFTNNDDRLDTNSIYHSDPFNYKGHPRIINPSFEFGMKGFLATKRIDYQCGRFFLSSLGDNCEPLESQPLFKERLFKIVITPECKVDIIKKYYTPREVSFVLSGLPGVHSYNGKLVKKYDHNFFYGYIDEEILKIINNIRKKEDFKGINT